MTPEQKRAIMEFTKEDFLGKPAITKASNAKNLIPSLLLGHEDLPRERFCDPWAKYNSDRGLTAVYSKNGAAVMHGEKVIASYHFGDHLVVSRPYRRQGIGAELVYQFRTRYPDVPPAKSRTKGSQALQKKVWERIEREGRILRCALGAAEEVEKVSAANIIKPAFRGL
jgi:GNAT superfamily N-acetyltransferase